MLKFSKRLISFVLCMMMVSAVAITAFAANDKELVTYHSDQIVPAESVLSNKIIYPSKEATPEAIAPRMGTGVKLFSMTVSGLSGDGLLTTLQAGNEKWVTKSSFPNGTAVIWSSLSSSSPYNVKEGFCRVNSSGDFVADVYVNVPANGDATKYPDVTGMDPDVTYYGFINNTTSSRVSGTIGFGYLD